MTEVGKRLLLISSGHFCRVSYANIIFVVMFFVLFI